jgi:hypothetical protein
MGVEHNMKNREQMSGVRCQGRKARIFGFSLEPRTWNLEPDSRGFTILLAALIASLVLALGISVFSIAQKQLILSSIGRNSQYAFYAADTGAECALFWDSRHVAFDPAAPVSPIACDANQAISVAHTNLLVYPVTYTFSFEPNGYCVQMTVTKNTVHPRTRIHADGFSVSCENVQVSSRVLQRSVELTY